MFDYDVSSEVCEYLDVCDSEETDVRFEHSLFQAIRWIGALHTENCSKRIIWSTAKLQDSWQETARSDPEFSPSEYCYYFVLVSFVFV